MADISKIQLDNAVYNIKDETARTNINNILQILNNLQKPKKYVFMGDSYGDGYTPDGTVTSWITLLAQKLNLQSGDYISTHRGGFRFAYSSSDSNYITLLNNLNDDPDLTDMYVCGGYNDAPSSENDILLGIQNFNNLFKTKFPNAKLHIGFIGWSKNSSSIRNLARAFYFYKKSCENLQIDFLDGCEYALHNYFKYFSSDGIHPNLTGQTSIANSLYDCITKGKANVIEREGLYFTLDDGIISSSNTLMILHDGIIDTVINGGSDTAIYFSFNTAKTQTGNEPLEIATISYSLLVGSDYNDITFNGVVCVVYDGSNYSKQVFDIIIKNGKIYVVNSGASGNNYQTITIKQIQIPAITKSFSALLG